MSSREEGISSPGEMPDPTAPLAEPTTNEPTTEAIRDELTADTPAWAQAGRAFLRPLLRSAMTGSAHAAQHTVDGLRASMPSALLHPLLEAQRQELMAGPPRWRPEPEDRARLVLALGTGRAEQWALSEAQAAWMLRAATEPGTETRDVGSAVGVLEAVARHARLDPATLDQLQQLATTCARVRDALRKANRETPVPVAAWRRRPVRERRSLAEYSSDMEGLAVLATLGDRVCLERLLERDDLSHPVRDALAERCGIGTPARAATRPPPPGRAPSAPPATGPRLPGLAGTPMAHLGRLAGAAGLRAEHRAVARQQLLGLVQAAPPGPGMDGTTAEAVTRVIQALDHPWRGAGSRDDAVATTLPEAARQAAEARRQEVAPFVRALDHASSGRRVLLSNWWTHVDVLAHVPDDSLARWLDSAATLRRLQERHPETIDRWPPAVWAALMQHPDRDVRVEAGGVLGVRRRVARRATGPGGGRRTPG